MPITNKAYNDYRKNSYLGALTFLQNGYILLDREEETDRFDRSDDRGSG
jgi:hypothetical protein